MEPQTLVLICTQISSTKLISLGSTDVLCHTRIWKRNDLKSQEKKISTEEDCRTRSLMVTRSEGGAGEGACETHNADTICIQDTFGL